MALSSGISSFLANRVTKAVVFAACLIPATVLVWRWTHHLLGANRVEAAQRYTGDWILLFLIYTLLITPLRRLPGLNAMIRYRRMLGLYAFFYACIHVAIYLWYDKDFDWLEIREDLLHRRFYIVGLIAFVFLVPLALTSTAGWIRRLGGWRWRMLHRLIYLSALAGALHYYLQGKSIVPRAVWYCVVMAILVVYRPIAFAVRKWHGPRGAGAQLHRVG